MSEGYRPEHRPDWPTAGGWYSQSVNGIAPGPAAAEQVPAGPRYVGLGPFLRAQRLRPVSPAPNRVPIMIGLVALLVIALVAISGVLVLHQDSKLHGTVKRTHAAAAAAPASAPDTVQAITVPAVTPGWQGVLSREQAVAYDVPPGWTVQTPGAFSGYQDVNGKLTTTMHGVTIYRQHACPQSRDVNRGMVGFMPIGPSDPRRAAVDNGRLWAQNAAVDSADPASGPAAAVRVNALPVQPISVDHGKIQAWQAATYAPVHPGTCLPPRVQVTTVAFPNRGTTVLFVAVMDQGVADAARADDITKIIASLRPE